MYDITACEEKKFMKALAKTQPVKGASLIHLPIPTQRIMKY